MLNLAGGGLAVADTARSETSGYARAVRKFLLEEPVVKDPEVLLKRLQGVPAELMPLIPRDYEDASGVIRYLGQNFLEPMQLLDAHASSALSARKKERIWALSWNARELIYNIICARRSMNGLKDMAERQKGMDLVKTLTASFAKTIDEMITVFNGEPRPDSGLLLDRQ